MKLNYRFAPLLVGLAALGAAGCGAGDLGLNKGGKLTGYHWGLTRKQAMLGWEAGRTSA